MDVVAIKISDFLFKIGNAVFNVKEVEYKGSNDLDYEESNTLPFNKVFYFLDKKVKCYKAKTHLLMSNFFNFFIRRCLKINFKTSKKVQQKPINNLLKINSYNGNTAHSVISNNVRNRLLKTINEDMKITDNKKYSNISKPKKLKNQFKSDIIENVDLEDESYESNGILNRLSLFVSRFI